MIEYLLKNGPFAHGDDSVTALDFLKKHRMECINKATGKLKKTFKVFEDAVAWAHKMNENPKFIHKQVAYKCSKCLRFHTGRSKHGTILHHEKDIYKLEQKQ